MLAPWVHELATYVCLTAAGAYLLVHLMRVSKPRGGPACARCSHALPTTHGTASQRGVRSKQLRVIG